jgi:hypothetical protein
MIRLKANPSPETAQAATEPSGIALNQLSLLGTLTGGGTAPKALLRRAGGRVVTLSVGERAGGDQVVGIADGHVDLSRGGQTFRLSMPGQ